MIARVRGTLSHGRQWIWAVVAFVLLAALGFGYKSSMLGVALLVAGIGAALLLWKPVLGLAILVPVTLISPLEFDTGTAVSINLATLLVPALLACWVLGMPHRQELRLTPSRVNLPLALFLLAGLLSLLIGIALWDPAVPRPENFTIVQVAQWAIFAFSAGAFWLTGNLVRDVATLRRLSLFYLAVAGSVAVYFVIGGGYYLVHRGIVTIALVRSPFWLLLTALAGGQLLFNETLSARWRLFLVVILGTVLTCVFVQERDTVSHWAGVAIVLGTLAWLRWPRLRWLAVVVLVILAGAGLLSSAVFDFAGGDAEWEESGISRMALIGRVIEVTMHNPITGLGPAAYRPYARLEPLVSGTVWFDFVVSSHNNYVDLFSHVGIVGLGLFLWFAAKVGMLGFRLRTRFTQGFAAGYVNAMLAALAGAAVLMMLADWILPFVYNIGFPGFQASVLVWLFLGGLVALEQAARSEAEASPRQDSKKAVG